MMPSRRRTRIGAPRTTSISLFSGLRFSFFLVPCSIICSAKDVSTISWQPFSFLFVLSSGGCVFWLFLHCVWVCVSVFVCLSVCLLLCCSIFIYIFPHLSIHLLLSAATVRARLAWPTSRAILMRGSKPGEFERIREGPGGPTSLLPPPPPPPPPMGWEAYWCFYNIVIYKRKY